MSTSHVHSDGFVTPNSDDHRHFEGRISDIDNDHKDYDWNANVNAHISPPLPRPSPRRQYTTEARLDLIYPYYIPQRDCEFPAWYAFSMVLCVLFFVYGVVMTLSAIVFNQLPLRLVFLGTAIASLVGSFIGYGLVITTYQRVHKNSAAEKGGVAVLRDWQTIGRAVGITGEPSQAQQYL